jgi:hypothetical protein
MAAIQRIFIGKVNKIEDEKSFAVKVSFIGENDLGEDGPTALPFGNINSEIKVDDKIILFQVEDRPYSFFYLPIRTNTGRIWLYNKQSYIDITDPDEMIIQHQDKAFIMSKGDLYINVDTALKILGNGEVEMKGVVTPDSTSYIFNCLPQCLFTGANHGGYKVQLMSPKQEPSDPPKEE